MFYVGPNKLIRNLGNKLGLAWWAKIESDQPGTIYWYGPFITKRSLNESLKRSLKSIEESKSITK